MCSAYAPTWWFIYIDEIYSLSAIICSANKPISRYSALLK